MYWLKWIDEVEALCGHDLDGNEATDGYSLDGCGDMFDSGMTPEDAFRAIVFNRRRVWVENQGA
jgi:hypothetical protein